MINLLLEVQQDVQQFIFDFKMEVFSQFLQKLKSGQNQIIQRNLEEIREVIVQWPQYVNYQDEGSKRTPIFTVSSYYEDALAMEILQFMMNCGANIRHEDVNKRTITFILCSRGMVNCLKMLLSKDEQMLLHRDRLGQTPLFAAVRENQFDFIRQLQLTPDLINMTDTILGQTILFYGAAYGYEKICKHLIKRGADLLIYDLCGQNILSYTQKIPTLHNKIRNKITKLENENGKEQSSQKDDKEHVVGKQAYEIRFLQNNQIRRATKSQKKQLLKQLRILQMTQKTQKIQKVQKSKKLQKSKKKESLLKSKKLSIDEYDDYNQNWRHSAIKIISGCLNMRNGKWFRNIMKGQVHLSEQDKQKIKGLDLMDFELIKTKLEHHIYQSPKQFQEDLIKISQNCTRLNNPNSLIYKYARELRLHIHRQIVEYNIMKKY